MSNRCLKKMMLSLLLFCATVQANQRIPVQEGVEVNALVSVNALNRLAVENDRIVSVKGNSGQFELDKDTELGQVFLKPLVSEGPIPIFISTEKGYTYHLGLTTHDRGAESVLLTPIGEVSAKWQQSGSYETVLKKIIKAMHTQSPLEGFVIENAKIKLPNIKGIKVVSLQSYVGPSLLGHVLEITNTTTEPLYLNELQFTLPGVRAISIIDKTLASKAKTRLYCVRS
jgi:type-F conjugative transfer system secretin TraK